MSKLNSTIRLAFSAALIAGFALPAAAIAQGKGHDKGKGGEKKAERAEVKRDKKHDDDKGEKERVVRVTTVQPVTQVTTIQRVQPVKVKKYVTTVQAVTVTRQVLVSNGFQVVNVVPSGTSQVIYYRRGNMGKGRGLGPVERIVVVPSGQVVQFQSVPPSLLSVILNRLGM
jgi:hypothetical protein